MELLKWEEEKIKRAMARGATANKPGGGVGEEPSIKTVVITISQRLGVHEEE